MQNYSNGTITGVTVYLTPFDIKPKLNADLGVYVQDQWTIKRLTINAGLRWEYLEQSVDATHKPAGRFSPETTWDPVNCDVIPGMTCWKTWAPRLGAAYDLRGDGKTALRFSFGKYMTPNTSSYAAGFLPVQQFNPGAQARTWTDTNLDNIAQDSEISQSTDPNYGLRVVRKLDPNINREFNRQYSIGIQHEVVRGVAASFNWYHRTLHDSQFSDNLLVNGSYQGADADWIPTTVANPLDGTPMTFFQIKQEKAFVGSSNLTRNFATSDDRRNTYNGFELGTTARLGRGLMLYGFWTFDHTINVACDSTDNPNTLRFCDESGTARLPGEPSVVRPYRHEFKVGGNVPVWYGFEASAALQSYAGAEKNVSWTVTPGTTRWPNNCDVAGCTPGEIVIPRRFTGDPSVTMLLATPGTRFLPRSTQLDFGVRRSFRVNGRRITPEFNVYNLLNDNAVLTELQVLGSNASVTPFLEAGTGGRPTGIMYPRIMRISVAVQF